MCLRTAKIKIETSNEVKETIEIYSKALQFCIDKAWEMRIRNNIKLHPFVYLDLRKMGLPSQLAVACIKQACGMVKKAYSKPTVSRTSMRYNFPRSASIKNNVLSISTIKGRRKFNVGVPECFKVYFTDWQVRESLLMMDKFNRTFFLFTFSHVEPNSSQTHRVLGLDVGVNNLAVSSERRFYGKDIKQRQIRHDNFVSRLQSKGTRASKRKLKNLSGKWNRFMRWTNHNISRSIVDSLNKGDTLVMENLNDIRRTASYNRWVHKWAFRQLQSFVEYKAIAKGCRVVYVNPAYTSKECNRCHCINSKRHSGFFECKICGHSLNADLNGARNIAQRYIRNMCKAIVTVPNFLCDDAILCV